MSFAEHRAEHRRITILRGLRAEPEYQLNDAILQDLLLEFGHAVARDVVLTDLAWLAEQGLLTVEQVAPGVRVATLTRRGADVARGRSVVPGVRRPSPAD